MLKDVEMTVPKTTETRVLCADKSEDMWQGAI